MKHVGGEIRQIGQSPFNLLLHGIVGPTNAGAWCRYYLETHSLFRLLWILQFSPNTNTYQRSNKCISFLNMCDEGALPLDGWIDGEKMSGKNLQLHDYKPMCFTGIQLSSKRSMLDMLDQYRSVVKHTITQNYKTFSMFLLDWTLFGGYWKILRWKLK